MDCREAELILSSLRDGEGLEAGEREALDGHVCSCASCAEFARALDAIDAAGVPSAPGGLVEAILASLPAAAQAAIEEQAIDAARAVADAARPTGPLSPLFAEPSWKPSWLDRRTLWLFTSAVTAAAALVTGVILYRGGAFDGLGAPSVTEMTRQPRQAASTGSLAAAPGPSADLASGTASYAPTSAPDYIAYGGFVYRAGPAVDASASTLTTIGATVSAFATTGLARSAPVFRSGIADGSIVVRTETGLILFAPVTRTLSGAAFQLAAGSAISNYGQWPALAGYAAPTKADGWPSFLPAGKDDLGVAVFAPPGTLASAGFAVAPGTTSGDPAAGNPGWTFWKPAPRP